jgi:hypothetical protein
VIFFLGFLGFSGVLGHFFIDLTVLGIGASGLEEDEESEYWSWLESIEEIMRGSSSLPFTLFFTFSGLDDCFFGISLFCKNIILYFRRSKNWSQSENIFCLLIKSLLTPIK